MILDRLSTRVHGQEALLVQKAQLLSKRVDALFVARQGRQLRLGRSANAIDAAVRTVDCVRALVRHLVRSSGRSVTERTLWYRVHARVAGRAGLAILFESDAACSGAHTEAGVGADDVTVPCSTGDDPGEVHSPTNGTQPML
jgi:hypothetical protein